MRSFYVRIVFAVLSAALMVPGTLFSYEVPLSERSVREAYFLGQRRDEKMARFFKDYTKALSLPESGPHVSEIALFTPYAQVVELSRLKSVGYSAQQAAEDYRERGDTIRVRVRILLTRTYTVFEAFDSATRARRAGDPELGASQFWREFHFELRQRGKAIPGIFVMDEPIYSIDGIFGGGLIGANVWFDYPAAQVQSEEIEAEVTPPDGQRVVAKFDLAKLR